MKTIIKLGAVFALATVAVASGATMASASTAKPQPQPHTMKVTVQQGSFADAIHLSLIGGSPEVASDSLVQPGGQATTDGSILGYSVDVTYSKRGSETMTYSQSHVLYFDGDLMRVDGHVLQVGESYKDPVDTIVRNGQDSMFISVHSPL